MAYVSVLPIIEAVLSGGNRIRALVDTGCSAVVIRACMVARPEGVSYMTAFDGREVECRGLCMLDLEVTGIPVRVRAVVIDSLVEGVDVVLGMELINQLGGVTICRNQVRFGGLQCSAAVREELTPRGSMGGGACSIKDKDFTAVFDGEYWTVEWVWKGEQIPVLKNKIGCYDAHLVGDRRKEFEKEVDRWIDDGILLPWEGQVVGGVLPLMAVDQPTKGKVRPVLDYRELNAYVECHTGDDITDVCSETLRGWRQMDGELVLVDLKAAYLQIRVSKELWKYQIVNYKGRFYCLTRLGFGLNCAPRIMSSILKSILGKSGRVKGATSSFVDDICVNVTKVSAEEVIQHLGRFGLVTKPPVPLDGGSALGLKIHRDETGELMFSRGNELPVVSGSLTRRELFSVCGKLVGHYPIAGWLRVACSYIKRRAEGVKWDDPVGDSAMKMVAEAVERVKRSDPVQGRWSVPGCEDGVVWCDSSSIAMGVLLEMGGRRVEDAAWLRKKGDYNHINVAELEAILKGVNLALKWNLTNISLITDSATVYGWVRVTLSEEKRIRTKGASEMIVKRRLGVLKNLIGEFKLKVTISLVSTLKNKADELTRVSKNWLVTEGEDQGADALVCASGVDVVGLHNMHHVGVDRTLFLARKVDPSVTRDAVQRVVRGCERCQSIDPAPVVHAKGEIGVCRNWVRLAVDVTHYRQLPYLTLVDCGPGRLAIWRELRREAAEFVILVLSELFLERGPVEELLMDNSTVFKSNALSDFLGKWNVRPFFRAAYRPSGNGIVERNHRTIKSIAERGGITPMEAVFWYNMSPRVGQVEDSVPQRSVFCYEWRHPAVDPVVVEPVGEPEVVKLGDEVWVKPPQARCTTQWGRGVVTEVNSGNNVSVDGMPRHVLDIRRVVGLEEGGVTGDEGGVVMVPEELDVRSCDGHGQESRYSGRVRRPPVWMSDYVSGDGE